MSDNEKEFVEKVRKVNDLFWEKKNLLNNVFRESCVKIAISVMLLANERNPL